MEVLVLSPCSKTKRYDPVMDCETIDDRSREKLVEEYSDSVATASEIYTGDEHQHIKQAVDELRNITDVDWRIISAGFGLLREDTGIPSYNCGFSGDFDAIRARAEKMGCDVEKLTRDETIQAIGREKRIPQDFDEVLENRYDLMFVLLGKRYLLSVTGALQDITQETTALAFAADGSKDLIGDCTWVPATEEERQKHETTFGKLRGLMFDTLVDNLTDEKLRELKRNPEKSELAESR